ncbi:kinase [Microlunatus parietis]|uniref:Putative kinase n=1 Tax=Microlunatus parietis TaxID=682979 RepID=A0A7Y9I1V0_9ACTN|nr:kinase [Microlunatus parietis]NYE68679.1 putative kinase [Microlunatus parietis]
MANPIAAGGVGAESTRFITFRGNSGSGKSTIAAAVREARPAGTLAIIGQDVIRREILGSGEDLAGHPMSLTDMIARHLLNRGVDVIVEGILNAAWYTDTLVQLMADHRGVSRSYIWKLPFEETVRRTATKPAVKDSWEQNLRKWWRGFQPVSGLNEQIIGPEESFDSTVERVLSECW